MQLVGLILICTTCPVITVMAGSLETILLAHAASTISAAQLLRTPRQTRPTVEREVLLSRFRNFQQQLQSRHTVSIFSIFCIATAMVLLGGLTGSSTLETIRMTLLDSYRPERLDLLVGDGSFLGVTAIVLLFAGNAAAFGLFPMHGVAQNAFESSPAWISGTTAILQRLHASIVLWKITIVAMPGFESNLHLLCLVLGISSCLGGAILACRSQSLRNLSGNLWIAWGGVGLLAAASGVVNSSPTNSQQLWQLPTGLETAAFAFVTSSVAVGMLLIADRWLAGNGRAVDFPEDVTGLGQQQGMIAFAVACSLLTLSAIPPLPGFWCAALITGNAFLPGVESSQGTTFVPHTSALLATALLLISLSIVASRSVTFLSLMFHHEPIRRFDIQVKHLTSAVSLTAASLLLWAGINVRTILTWFHKLPL